MLELFILFEFFKNILNLNYTNVDINLAKTEKTISYEEFNQSFKQNKNKEQLNLIEIDFSKISAKNILIKEIGGETLIEKNADTIKPIASLTKLISAVVALTNYNDQDEFLIKEIFLKNNDAEKNSKFKENEKYNLKELINIMLISSSNISAWALADKMKNNNFIEKMNETAKRYGALNTKFVEPSGISDNNISNLKDLYLITQNILKEYPEIFEISIKSDYLVKKYKNIRIIYNTNYLLQKYKNIILGSKTGFTDKAGQCLILLVKYPKSPLIFLGLLDSKNRIKDAEYLLEELKKLYE
ncbi:MAG: hypothetical protein KatS3mg095_0766 [Candidatus Parcubacteria bacterium]|nr:MAG: hypothetical protein KatS3mg095_0766 [Candidatus Parcubacteria bacterium]